MEHETTKQRASEVKRQLITMGNELHQERENILANALTGDPKEAIARIAEIDSQLDILGWYQRAFENRYREYLVGLRSLPIH